MIRHTAGRLSAALAAICIACALTACDGSNNGTKEKTDPTPEVTASAETDRPETTPPTTDSSGKNSGSALTNETVFTARDLVQNPDLKDATELSVSDGETISVTKDGTYHITGSAENCTIRVEAGDKAKVQLVLDGVTIVNKDFPAIYVVSADKCLITSLNSNALTVSGAFRADGQTNTDAVIFSRDDIVLNGTGSLSVTSAKGNGISSKDDLKATGGTYTLTTALDSLEANDTISVCDGTFVINSQKDGLHCENEDDSSLGNIYISGGTFTINAKSDAIQGTTNVVLDGGTLDLKGREGIEGTYITINDGSLTIDATDDGINAAKKSTVNGSPVVIINGGNVTITVGQGDTDAIDSNGDIYVNGGTITVSSTVSSFDYEGKAEYNGGTIIINGEKVDSIPNSMMGGPGGFRGNGRQGNGGDGSRHPGGTDGGKGPFGGREMRSEDDDTPFNRRSE